MSDRPAQQQEAAEPIGIPPLAHLSREAYDQMLHTGMLQEIYPAATGVAEQDLNEPGQPTTTQHPQPDRPSMALPEVIKRMRAYQAWRRGTDPRTMTDAGILPGQIGLDLEALLAAAVELEGCKDALDHYWRTNPSVLTACQEVMNDQTNSRRVREAALRAVGAGLDLMPKPENHQVLLAHRILATNTPDGVHRGPVANLCSNAPGDDAIVSGSH